MKKLLFVIGLLLIASIAEAKIYVCLSKTDGTPQGAVDINETAIADWAKKFTMIEADESYRGKQGYEMKYQGQKLRHATEQEISDYKQTQEQSSEALKKASVLATLGLEQKDIAKIKKLPEAI